MYLHKGIDNIKCLSAIPTMSVLEPSEVKDDYAWKEFCIPYVAAALKIIENCMSFEVK